MRKNPFIAMGYWTLFAVNLWVGCCFAAFNPEQASESLLANIKQLIFAIRIMGILAYICRNWRNRKNANSPKRITAYKATVISGTSYFIGICLILWASPNIWSFLFGHFLLLSGGYHLGKQLAKIIEMKRRSSLEDDQDST